MPDSQPVTQASVRTVDGVHGFRSRSYGGVAMAEACTSTGYPWRSVATDSGGVTTQCLSDLDVGDCDGIDVDSRATNDAERSQKA